MSRRGWSSVKRRALFLFGPLAASIAAVVLFAGPASAVIGPGGGGEAVSCTKNLTKTWYTSSLTVDDGGCYGNVATWSVRIPGDTCSSSDVYRAEVYTPSHEWFYPYRDDQPYCTNGTTYQSKYDPAGNESGQAVALYIQAGCGCGRATTAYITITIYKQ
jgi:hypothetical protein